MILAGPAEVTFWSPCPDTYLHTSDSFNLQENLVSWSGTDTFSVTFTEPEDDTDFILARAGRI